MQLIFRKLRRGEIREASRLAMQAFDDYEYFTNWFPDKGERNRVQYSIIYHEYKTNFSRTRYLAAYDGGRMAAVAQLNPPSYKKPSDLRYLFNGWLNVYKTGDKQRIDDWLSMDAAAGKPCHEYQKTEKGVWYASSLTVNPRYQGQGVGTEFLHYWEDYVRGWGGKQIVLFTNSRDNLDFYLKRGYEVFDKRDFHYNGHTMESWSLRKSLFRNNKDI